MGCQVVSRSAVKANRSRNYRSNDDKKAGRNGNSSPRTYFAEAATKVRRHEVHEGKEKEESEDRNIKKKLRKKRGIRMLEEINKWPIER